MARYVQAVCITESHHFNFNTMSSLVVFLLSICLCGLATSQKTISVLQNCGKTVHLGSHFPHGFIQLEVVKDAADKTTSAPCELTLAMEKGYEAYFRFYLIDMKTCNARLELQYNHEVFGFETMFSSYPHFCGSLVKADEPVMLNFDEGITSYKLVFIPDERGKWIGSSALFEFTTSKEKGVTNWPTTPAYISTTEASTVLQNTDKSSPTNNQITVETSTTINITKPRPTSTENKETSTSQTNMDSTTTNPTTMEVSATKPSTIEATSTRPITMEATSTRTPRLEITTIKPTTVEASTKSTISKTPTIVEATSIRTTVIETTTTTKPTTMEPASTKPITMEATSIRTTSMTATTIEASTTKSTTIEAPITKSTTIEAPTTKSTTIESTSTRPITMEATTHPKILEISTTRQAFTSKQTTMRSTGKILPTTRRTRGTTTSFRWSTRKPVTRKIITPSAPARATSKVTTGKTTKATATITATFSSKLEQTTTPLQSNFAKCECVPVLWTYMTENEQWLNPIASSFIRLAGDCFDTVFACHQFCRKFFDLGSAEELHDFDHTNSDRAKAARDLVCAREPRNTFNHKASEYPDLYLHSRINHKQCSPDESDLFVTELSNDFCCSNELTPKYTPCSELAAKSSGIRTECDCKFGVRYRNMANSQFTSLYYHELSDMSMGYIEFDTDGTCYKAKQACKQACLDEALKVKDFSNGIEKDICMALSFTLHESFPLSLVVKASNSICPGFERAENKDWYSHNNFCCKYGRPTNCWIHEDDPFG